MDNQVSELLKQDYLYLDKIIKKYVEYWNPFTEYRDISSFIDKPYYFILGPVNDKGQNYLWRFRIICSDNKIVLSTNENSNNGDPCIAIEINNNIGKINYINKCKDLTGKIIIGWTIEIIKKLGGRKCILRDFASKKCNESKYKNYVQLSLIHKLKKDKTYYEEFDFIPYNSNNNIYKNNKIIELNQLVDTIQNIPWEEYNINDEEWNKFYNLYRVYPSPFSAFVQFTEYDCQIFYNILFLLDKPEQPCYIILNKIKSIIKNSIWMKLL